MSTKTPTTPPDGAPKISTRLVGGRKDHSAPVEMREIGHRKGYWQWPVGAVLILLALLLLSAFLENPNLELDVIGQYLLSPPILSGVLVTLELTALCMVAGVIGGLVVALMRMSGNPLLTSIAVFYLWFFRSVPIIVQLLFWGFIGAFLPILNIGIPFTDVSIGSINLGAAMSPFLAAFMGLTLNEIAQASEIIRGGLMSVDSGQTLAAKAIGLSPFKRLRRIILPQALRFILPPLGNSVILMVKTTSLVSVIGGLDLLTRTQNVYLQTFQILPLLTVATIWYLVIISVLSIAQEFLERYYGRGAR